MIMLDNWAQECAKLNFYAILKVKISIFNKTMSFEQVTGNSPIVCPNFFVVT